MMMPAHVRYPGRLTYADALAQMQSFTDQRGAETPDEIWFLEHPPVFTLGVNAADSHVLNAGDTPVVRVDRGGQVTWHGPGQLVVYVLLDLKRRKLGIRDLVCRLERSVIRLLETYGIESAGREGAPGVYTHDAKIASIGLRVRHQRCYHGLSLNVCNDLEPFSRINPCGYEGLQVTRTCDLGGAATTEQAASDLLPFLADEVGFEPVLP